MDVQQTPHIDINSLDPPTPCADYTSENPEVDYIIPPPPEFADLVPAAPPSLFPSEKAEAEEVFNDSELMDQMNIPWLQDECSAPTSVGDDDDNDSACLNPDRLALDYIDYCYQNQYCPLCDETFRADLDLHFINHHPEYYDQFNQRGYGAIEVANMTIEELSSAHNRVQVKFGVKNLEQLNISDLRVLFKSTEAKVKRVIKSELNKRKNIKVFMNMMCLMVDNKTGEEHRAGFTSFAHVLLRDSQLPWLWHMLTSKLERRLEDYTRKKTGLTLQSVLAFEFTIATYRPLFGAKYMELPFPLNTKTHTFVNIRNDIKTPDEAEKKCFLWSVLAHDQLGGVKYLDDRNRHRSRYNTNPFKYMDDVTTSTMMG